MTPAIARRFLIQALGIAALLLSSIAAFNHRVDPFLQYRAPSGEARYQRQFQRYIAPGIAKHSQYDFIITGSSLMENYGLAEAGRRCNARAVNLVLAAMSAWEQRQILQTALAAQRVKRVVMSVDFNSFAAPIDASLPDIPDPLPLHLYDTARWNDYRYLLNGSVTLHSIALATGTPKGRYVTNPDRAWNWMQEVSFSAARALKDIDPTHINKRFKQGPRTLTHMQANFEANFIPLFEKHQDTQFNLVFPPYSIMVWADFAQRQQLEISLAFKRYVFSRIKGLSNVRVFDMQSDAAITHDFNRYSDIYHFDPETNLKLLDAACADESPYRVTPQSQHAFETALRAQIGAFDPAAAVASVHLTH
jgi:hypothetical protein